MRFGEDPATSALDVDCRAHDVDNLYVVDTSFFPQLGAVNPALTAMANALRVGDHLIERLGAKPRRGRAGGAVDDARRWPRDRPRPARRPGRHRRDDGLFDDRGQAARAAVLARAGATRRPRRSASSRFESDAAYNRFTNLSHWGYGTGWGVVRGLLRARGVPPVAATAAHGAAVWGTRRSRSRRSTSRRRLAVAAREVAIDLFHHAVYAVATGVAYELIGRAA